MVSSRRVGAILLALLTPFVSAEAQEAQGTTPPHDDDASERNDGSDAERYDADACTK